MGKVKNKFIFLGGEIVTIKPWGLEVRKYKRRGNFLRGLLNLYRKYGRIK